MHSHPQNCPQCDYIYVTRHAYESHSWWQGFRFWRQLQPDALTPGSLHYSKDMLGLVPGKGQCSQEESRPSVIMCTCMLSFFSHVQLFVIHTPSTRHIPPHPTPTTMDCSLQAPLSMGFSRQEYWSGCHFLLQRIFLIQGSKLFLLCFLPWQSSSLLLELSGKPINDYTYQQHVIRLHKASLKL